VTETQLREGAPKVGRLVAPLISSLPTGVPGRSGNTRGGADLRRV
jgi:hypothetical protein